MGSESLSGAFGWVSIACWIVVYSPQVVENYQLQSGEGLSVAFVLIWLAGDLCNFFGAIMAGLQATVIMLAIYYTFCDITLLGQIYYYRWKRIRLIRRISAPTSTPTPPPPQVILHSENGEQAPLLGSRSPSSVSSGKAPGTGDSEARGNETNEFWIATLRYALAMLFVIGVGMAAWFVGRRHHQGEGEGAGPYPGSGGGEAGGGREKDVVEWKGQVIGWTSAVLYLGSRIPQILKNFKTRCEGLSLALFLFSIAGNVTYVLSICTESMSSRHLVANAAWLAGSGLTVFLDVFVLCQFFYFRRTDGRYSNSRRVTVAE
ncbi:RTC2 [Sanghuangporus sanghuang]